MKNKKKSSFYEEKSLVRLTPDWTQIKGLCKVFFKSLFSISSNICWNQSEQTFVLKNRKSSHKLAFSLQSSIKSQFYCDKNQTFYTVSKTTTTSLFVSTSNLKMVHQGGNSIKEISSYKDCVSLKFLMLNNFTKE